MLMREVDPHVVRYLGLIVITDGMVETQLNNNLNFPINKIRILVYDLYDKEILDYTHNSIYFLL